MIDRAKSLPPSSLRRTLPMFWRISAIGSSTPIMPVLATSTSSSSTPACRAASAAISCASSKPCSPTQQFAHPLLATTACAVPLATRSRLNVTEGDSTLFVVKVPAAVAGVSDTTTPRSRFPSPTVFSPANVPPALNPRADVTPPPRSTSIIPAPAPYPKIHTRRRNPSHYPGSQSYKPQVYHTAPSPSSPVIPAKSLPPYSIRGEGDSPHTPVVPAETGTHPRRHAVPLSLEGVRVTPHTHPSFPRRREPIPGGTPSPSPSKE